MGSLKGKGCVLKTRSYSSPAICVGGGEVCMEGLLLGENLFRTKKNTFFFSCFKKQKMNETEDEPYSLSIHLLLLKLLL